MITLNSISHTYPGESEAALRDVSLTLADATVTALVGPNGSGKTTLTQILGGLLPPSSGSVSINGTEMSPNDLLGYSVMVSSDRDFDNSSASAVVAYAALRPTWDQKLFDHYTHRFGFRLKGRKKLRKMSSGQVAVLTGAVLASAGLGIGLSGQLVALLRLAAGNRISRAAALFQVAQNLGYGVGIGVPMALILALGDAIAPDARVHLFLGCSVILLVTGLVLALRKPKNRMAAQRDSEE